MSPGCTTPEIHEHVFSVKLETSSYDWLYCYYRYIHPTYTFDEIWSSLVHKRRCESGHWPACWRPGKVPAAVENLPEITARDDIFCFIGLPKNLGSAKPVRVRKRPVEALVIAVRGSILWASSCPQDLHVVTCSHREMGMEPTYTCGFLEPWGLFQNYFIFFV